jgi:hypothetical protein
MVYIVWATGKTQPWNNPPQPNKPIENGISDKEENLKKSKDDEN